MSKLIRIKRGLDARRLEVVPALGELIWTTDFKELWIGDGVSIGGTKVTGNIEDLFIEKSTKGQPNGVASLDASGTVPAAQIPVIAISQTYVVNSQFEQLALPAQIGDVAIRTDENRTYIHNGGSAMTMADWTVMAVPADAVQAVNGQTGTVILGLGDIDHVDLTAGVVSGDLIQWDGSDWVPVAASTIGTKQFSALEDTPNAYTGADGNMVVVDETNDRLTFTDVIDGGTYNGNTSTLNVSVAPATLVQNTATASAPRSEGRVAAVKKTAGTRIRRPRTKRI